MVPFHWMNTGSPGKILDRDYRWFNSFYLRQQRPSIAEKHLWKIADLLGLHRLLHLPSLDILPGYGYIMYQLIFPQGLNNIIFCPVVGMACSGVREIAASKLTMFKSWEKRLWRQVMYNTMASFEDRPDRCPCWQYVLCNGYTVFLFELSATYIKQNCQQGSCRSRCDLELSGLYVDLAWLTLLWQAYYSECIS